MKSRLVVALAFLCAACAGALRDGRVTFHQADAVRRVPRGINDGFHGPIGPDLVAHDCAYRQPFTIRTPQLSGASLDAFRLSIAACPQLHVLALVEGPDVALAAELAQRPIDAIELGNELELPPHALTPQAYAAFVKAAYAAVRAVNPTVTIITGGVYALTDDTKARVALALAQCPGCWAGLHLYEPLSASDLAWLTSLNVPIAVTETGYPTRCDPARIVPQQQYIANQLYDFSTVPNVQLVVIYQRPSGPTCSDLDTFGLQRPDGTWTDADVELR
jgi:hypothetical protein